MIHRLIIILCLFFCYSSYSEKAEIVYLDSCGAIINTEVIEISNVSFSEKKPNPVLRLFQKKIKRNKRITAAVLAFPFPFGIVGLHRIYLGTKPFVPLVYIGSLGGGFGVLPFIDFCVLILDKDVEPYINNEKIFMWIK